MVSINMKRKRVGYQMPTIFFCVMLLCGCSQGERKKGGNSLKVKTEQVSAFNEKFGRTYIGIVEETESIALSFSVSGTIQSIDFAEGSPVSKGMSLAFLDHTSAGSALETAEANLGQARDAHNRMSQLYKNASLPEIKMVEMEAKLQQAQAAYNMAKKNYEDCILKAPFSGVIGKKSLSAGENALPGQAVCTLLDIDEVKVKIAVPEMEVAHISDSEETEITVPALGNNQFKGIKIEKGIKANPFTHTYDMHVIVNNPSHVLLPGMVCKVHLWHQEEQVSIAVPTRAVQTGEKNSLFVWTVKEGMASRTRVRTGEVIGNRIVILEGLKEGDRIIVDGYQKVSEGTKIEF